MNLEERRYPIGRFTAPDLVRDKHVRGWIDEIERFPAVLRSVVEPLTDAQLDTPYRPGGWTVRQVVHHLADSHINGYVRLKWALTENVPTIREYFEDRWAELPDAVNLPVSVSLDLLDALHARWAGLLRGLDRELLRRKYVHPQSGLVSLDVHLGLYAWHGRHHLAHITRLIAREGWNGRTPS